MNREKKLQGKHIFKITAILNKLGLVEELKEAFKELLKQQEKQTNLNVQLIARLDGQEATQENIAKILKDDNSFAKEFSVVQGWTVNKLADIVGLIIARMSQAEDDITNLIKDVYGYKKNEEVGFLEIIEHTKDIFTSEEVVKGLQLLFKF